MWFLATLLRHADVAWFCFPRNLPDRRTTSSFLDRCVFHEPATYPTTRRNSSYKYPLAPDNGLLLSCINSVSTADRGDGRWRQEPSDGGDGDEPGLQPFPQRLHHLPAAGQRPRMVQLSVVGPLGLTVYDTR